MDVGRQRVGVCGSQLRKLPPFEHGIHQLTGVLGKLLVARQIVEQIGTRLPLAGFGTLAARQLELVEQQFAELARGAEIELVPGQRIDLFLQPRDRLRELPGQPRQRIAIDLDACPLHAGNHRHQRTFQRFIDGRHPLRRQPRPQPRPQPQRHVGIFRRVLRRLVDRHARERLVRLFGARRVRDHLVERDRRMLQVAFRQRIHAVIATSAVERIRQQQSVVERLHLDAIAAQHQQVIFEVLTDLENRRILEQRLQCVERGAQRDLLRAAVAVAEIECIRGRLVRQRHVAGATLRQPNREADQLRHHRIARGRLGVDAEMSVAAGVRNPLLQPRHRRHGLVGRPVDRRRPRHVSRECNHRTRCTRASRLLQSGRSTIRGGLARNRSMHRL